MQLALLHRQRRRIQRLHVESYVLNTDKVTRHLRHGNGQPRMYAAARGKFHAALMEWRYDLASEEGSFERTCEQMITTLVAAARNTSALKTVEEDIVSLANQGIYDDDVFFEILQSIEYELLPSGDSDDSIFLQLEWHPTSSSPNAVRTAYALLSRLRSLAVSNRQGSNDGLILRYFRIHVEKARGLTNLIVDSTGRSLPDLLHNSYLTTLQRGVYDTAAGLAKALKEPSSIGMAALHLSPAADSSRSRPRQPATPSFPADGGEAIQPTTTGQSAAILAASVYAAARQSVGQGRTPVPERARDQLHYIDLVLVWTYASVITVRIPPLTEGGCWFRRVRAAQRPRSRAAGIME